MYVGKTRNPVVVILLSIVTCGIYGLYWVYSCASDINGVTGQQRISPGLFILSMFIPYLPLYFAYKTDQNLVEIGRTENVAYESKFVLWLILFLVGIGYLVFFYQTQEMLNSIWRARGSNQ